MSANDRPTATPDRDPPYWPNAFGVRMPQPRRVRRRHPWPAPASKRGTDPGPVAYVVALLLPVLLAALGALQLLSAVR